jgi:hypothetical protein
MQCCQVEHLILGKGVYEPCSTPGVRASGAGETFMPEDNPSSGLDKKYYKKPQAYMSQWLGFYRQTNFQRVVLGNRPKKASDWIAPSKECFLELDRLAI